MVRSVAARQQAEIHGGGIPISSKRKPISDHHHRKGRRGPQRSEECLGRMLRKPSRACSGRSGARTSWHRRPWPPDRGLTDDAAAEVIARLRRSSVDSSTLDLARVAVDQLCIDYASQPHRSCWPKPPDGSRRSSTYAAAVSWRDVT
jgi:hypothetical protein